MIWNPIAIDYSKGVEYYDCETKKVYSLEEIQLLPREIKERICMRGKKIGCWVYKIEEFDMLKEIERENNEGRC